MEGKVAFGRRIKKNKFKRIKYINDSQSGDGFPPGSALSNAALCGDVYPYCPDSETGEGVLIPHDMLLYFCLKA